MTVSDGLFKLTAAPKLKAPHELHENIGMLLLAIYLILVGLNAIIGFIIPGILLGLLALLAGIFILIGK